MLVVVLGVFYGVLLLLWVLSALPALIAAIPGEFVPPAMVVPWVLCLVGWLAVPVTCLIALDALFDGVLDGRSLLPALALGVVLAGVGLGSAVIAVDGALRRRRPAPSPPPSSPPSAPPQTVEAEIPGAWREFGPLPVRGVRALGFADDPETGRELMLVVTTQGSGVFDTTDGTRAARDDEPDWGLAHLVTATGPRYPGIGPLAEHTVPVAGPGLGALPLRRAGWRAEVVSGDDGDRLALHREGPDGRAAASRTVCALPSRIGFAGFSPSGRTLVGVFDAALWWCTRD